MFRFYAVIFVSLLVIIQAARSETEFHITQEYPGKYSIQSQYFARLAHINPDPYLDVVLVKEDSIKVYLNKGNGKLTEDAVLRIKLKARPTHLDLTPSESEQAVISIRYADTAEKLNLSQLFASQVTQRFHTSFMEDSLNFQQVWSWQFPINLGSNPMTAGDLDNDGRMEIISSMTDTASIEHGWIIIYESVGDNTYQHDLTIEVNFHAWFHQMKITDWDQDGNKELTCAVAFRIRIWEFYGDDNYMYFDTNISMSPWGACSGIEVVNTNNDSLLELLTIFTSSQLIWSSSIELYEFSGKSINPAYFSWISLGIRQETSQYYSFASGDMDNDGWLDILLGYGQIWPPSPNTLYYLEYDPINQQFLPKYFSHPYPIDPSFSVIDDIDGDGLNEAFITGVGGGYGGLLYLKSYQPDQYQILMVDSTLYESAGSRVKTTIINGKMYIAKACQHLDLDSNIVYYYINLAERKQDNHFISLWSSTFHEPESYIHFFEILDTDHDSKENIVYKKVSYYGTDLFDLEKTTVSLINNNAIIPKEFQLLPNFPNPFNQTTTLNFITNKVEPYEIIIYDVLGRRVWEKTSYLSLPGKNHIRWDGKNMEGVDVGSGIYYYRVSSKTHTQCAKMVLIR
ncbi:MAG: hypothetical protein Kow0042_24550 [Calditrichia bacterium]